MFNALSAVRLNLKRLRRLALNSFPRSVGRGEVPTINTNGFPAWFIVGTRSGLLQVRSSCHLFLQ